MYHELQNKNKLRIYFAIYTQKHLFVLLLISPSGIIQFISIYLSTVYRNNVSENEAFIFCQQFH